MTTPDAQPDDPARIVGWALRLGPPDDVEHHAIVGLGELELRAACGVVIANATRHCFHAGRDAKVTPRCSACDAAAGNDRRAQAVYELQISATYSRHG